MNSFVDTAFHFARESSFLENGVVSSGPPNLDCSVFIGSDTVFFGGQRLFFIMP